MTTTYQKDNLPPMHCFAEQAELHTGIIASMFKPKNTSVREPICQEATTVST